MARRPTLFDESGEAACRSDDLDNRRRRSWCGDSIKPFREPPSIDARGMSAGNADSAAFNARRNGVVDKCREAERIGDASGFSASGRESFRTRCRPPGGGQHGSTFVISENLECKHASAQIGLRGTVNDTVNDKGTEQTNCVPIVPLADCDAGVKPKVFETLTFAATATDPVETDSSRMNSATLAAKPAGAPDMMPRREPRFQCRNSVLRTTAGVAWNSVHRLPAAPVTRSPRHSRQL